MDELVRQYGTELLFFEKNFASAISRFILQASPVKPYITILSVFCQGYFFLKKVNAAEDVL